MLIMGVDTLWLELIDGSWSGVVFEMIAFAYCFAGLAIVCDKYLVVSLETLCVRWGIREDVAGATFMAFGSAAPEIIINAINTLQGESDLGVGAIIGSGMIAFSVIPGLCALVAGKDLLLKRRPLARDSLTYLIALICLVSFFSDGFIELWEACVLLSLYILYVLLVFLSPSLRKKFRAYNKKKKYQQRVKEAMAVGAGRETLEELKQEYLLSEEKKSFVVAAKEAQKQKVKAPDLSSSLLSSSSPSLSFNGETNGNSDYSTQAVMSDDEDDVEHRPAEEDEDEDNSWKGKSYRTITRPLELAFYYTCPECQHDGPRAKIYPLTFLVAFLWVSFFSFTISAIAGRWNELTGLPLSLFGIVLVAVGAEIPDTISSLAVARRGYGSMAISNSCGSQITNILFGLGLPWTLANIAGAAQGYVEGYPLDQGMVDSISRPVRYKGVQIKEHKDTLIAASYQFFNLAMFMSILLVAALIARVDKATLTRTKGFILVGVYTVTVIGFCVTSSVVSPTTEEPYYNPIAP